jgi:hypothetical protein
MKEGSNSIFLMYYYISYHYRYILSLPSSMYGHIPCHIWQVPGVCVCVCVWSQDLISLFWPGVREFFPAYLLPLCGGIHLVCNEGMGSFNWPPSSINTSLGCMWGGLWEEPMRTSEPELSGLAHWQITMRFTISSHTLCIATPQA